MSVTTSQEIKELKGRIIRIDGGEKQEIVRVRVRDGIAVAEDGTEMNVADIEKRGRGLFYTSQKKPRRSTKPATSDAKTTNSGRGRTRKTEAEAKPKRSTTRKQDDDGDDDQPAIQITFSGRAKKTELKRSMKALRAAGHKATINEDDDLTLDVIGDRKEVRAVLKELQEEERISADYSFGKGGEKSPSAKPSTKTTSSRVSAKNKKTPTDILPETKEKVRKILKDKPKRRIPVETFDDENVKNIGKNIHDFLLTNLAEATRYAINVVSVGGTFNENSLILKLTVVSSDITDKELKSIIKRADPEDTEIVEEEEDDDLSDMDEEEDLDEEEDDEADGEDATSLQPLIDGLDVLDLKKIARKLGLTTKKSMDADDVVELITEEVEEDEDRLRAAAEEAQVDLIDDADDDDDEEEDDEEEDDALDDDELEDDEEEDDDEEEEGGGDVDSDEEDDEEDESDDDSDSDDDEEESEEGDDEEEEIDVDSCVAKVAERFPDLSEAKVRAYVEAYFDSDVIEDKLGDDLIPGMSELSSGDLTLLLVGFDSDEEKVRLINTKNGKFRSATISEVAKMEEL